VKGPIVEIFFGIVFSLIIAGLFLWAIGNRAKLPAPPQTNRTPDEWLIEELQKMDGVHVLEINATQTIEVSDKTGSSYGLEIGPATVVIIKKRAK
jgi:hypothetical protein